MKDIKCKVCEHLGEYSEGVIKGFLIHETTEDKLKLECPCCNHIFALCRDT